MTQKSIDEIVTALAKALETRDYSKFVSFFADDAVFEIPFSIEGRTILTGMPKIKEHFDNISKSPWARLIQIESVTTKSYFSTTPDTATVEYFMEGTVQNGAEKFKIPSSIALIQFKESQITHYKDYPNTIGIAKKAGILPQLAASWTK